MGLINPPLTSTSSLNEAAAVAAAAAKVENNKKLLHLNTNNVKSVKITMYNFGSPRVGNNVFSAEFNRLLPDSFRVEVDGDVVTGVPKGSYKHVGTNVTVDALGAGSIIIDPSYLEMRLRTRTKAHVSVHSLIVYRQGLLGVRAAAEFMQNHAKNRTDSMDAFDTVKLAIRAGPLKIWTMLGRETQSDRQTSSTNQTLQSHTATAVDHPQSAEQAEADTVLLQDIEKVLPIAPMPRMTTQSGTDDASDRKDAMHLAHDNQVNEELFASIRAHQAILGGNKLTQQMQRSIKMFRFRVGDKGTEEGVGGAEGNTPNPMQQSVTSSDSLSRDKTANSSHSANQL